MSAAVTDLTTAGGRVMHVVDTLFGGNLSAAADAFGVSAATLSKVRSGERQPGRKVLDGVLGTTNARLEWLYGGVGGPFLGDAPALLADGEPALPADGAPAARTPIRIASRPLSTQPGGEPYRLTGGALELPGRDPTTAYWLLLSPANVDVDLAPLRGFAAGDLLLMETDRRRLPNAGGLHGLPCVVRAGPGLDVTLLALAWHGGVLGVARRDPPQTVVYDDVVAAWTGTLHRADSARYR